MTALAPAAAAGPPIPAGYWQREGSHYPLPLSPFARSTMLADVNASFRRIFEEYGLLLETLEFREIGGWVYNRQVPVGGKDRGAPPRWAMWLAARTLPSLRKRIRRNVRAIREDRGWDEIERWYRVWRPEQERTIAQLRAVRLTELSDADLRAHLERVFAFGSQSWEVHFRLGGGPSITLAELAFACEDLLGWDGPRPFDLLRGLSTASTRPARQLSRLAALARERPPVRAALEGDLATAAGALSEVDAEFAAAFAAYQDEFGCRALRYEIADPTLAEVPAVTLGMIRHQIERGYDPAAEEKASAATRAAALEEARAGLAGRPATDRERFERALERARTFYPVREDNEFWTVSAPLALQRYAALELGRRLADRGQITDARDIFFLEYSESLDAFGYGTRCREIVARRKEQRARALAKPGPPRYGHDPGPPPSFDFLPAEAAQSAKAMFWLLERVFETTRSGRAQSVPGTIGGVPAAGGTYTGPARIIRGEHEFDRIRAGDVLVCPVTSPVWSVLFPSIGALVTDSGGILSHPAIIAREYGIPAVVATGNATALLRDGELVTVDGDTGEVRPAQPGV